MSRLFSRRIGSPTAIPGVHLTSPAGRASSAIQMLKSTSLPTVESRTSWFVASVALVIMAVAFGAPWITVVALKNIAAEVDGQRSIPAFASALMWIGSGFGGILM